MRKNKKQRRIMFLLILILCLTLGFALLSTTLKINGTANIKSNTWDIHWDESTINVSQGSVTAEDPEVSGTGDDTVSFDVELELPGDFYEFEIDAVNEGSIDGAINTVSTLIYDSSDLEHPLSDGDIPEYLLYTVTYDDGTAPQDGDILAANDSKTYKIRLEYDEDWDEPVDSDEEYVVKIQIPYVQHKEETTSPIVLPTGKTKDTLETGDTIKIQDEEFNFLHYEGINNEDIVMLAKYNLKVGKIFSSSNTTLGEYTSNDSGYGLQSSEVRGYVTGETRYGTLVFSTTNYWDDNGSPSSSYPGSYYPGPNYPTIYDATNYKGAPGEYDGYNRPTNPNYSVAHYVEAYKTILTNYGVTIKNARLLTYDEATDSSIGCDGNNYECPTNGFITNTSFWLGSAYYSANLWCVNSDGSYDSCNYRTDVFFGVRPVIVISKSEIN